MDHSSGAWEDDDAAHGVAPSVGNDVDAIDEESDAEMFSAVACESRHDVGQEEASQQAEAMQVFFASDAPSEQQRFLNVLPWGELAA